MCDPVTMSVMAIASAASSVYAQQQTQKAAERSNQQAYDNQMTAYRFNQANNNNTRVQEAANLAEQKIKNDSAAVRARSKATVMAGEGGVTGLSVDALLADLAGRAGNDNATAEVNYLRRDQALGADMYNTWSNTASGINSLKTPAAPDYLGAALKIGTAYNSMPSSTSTTGGWGGTTSDPWYG